MIIFFAEFSKKNGTFFVDDFVNKFQQKSPKKSYFFVDKYFITINNNIVVIFDILIVTIIEKSTFVNICQHTMSLQHLW